MCVCVCSSACAKCASEAGSNRKMECVVMLLLRLLEEIAECSFRVTLKRLKSSVFPTLTGN